MERVARLREILLNARSRRDCTLSEPPVASAQAPRKPENKGNVVALQFGKQPATPQGAPLACITINVYGDGVEGLQALDVERLVELQRNVIIAARAALQDSVHSLAVGNASNPSMP